MFHNYQFFNKTLPRKIIFLFITKVTVQEIKKVLNT